MNSSRKYLMVLTALAVSFHANDASAKFSAQDKKYSPTQFVRPGLNTKMKVIGVPRSIRMQALKSIGRLSKYGSGATNIIGEFKSGRAGGLVVHRDGVSYGTEGAAKSVNTFVKRLPGPGPIRWSVTQSINGKLKQSVVDKHGKPAKTKKPLPRP